MRSCQTVTRPSRFCKSNSFPALRNSPKIMSWIPSEISSTDNSRSQPIPSQYPWRVMELRRPSSLDRFLTTRSCHRRTQVADISWVQRTCCPGPLTQQDPQMVHRGQSRRNSWYSDPHASSSKSAMALQATGWTLHKSEYSWSICMRCKASETVRMQSLPSGHSSSSADTSSTRRPLIPS